MFGTTERMTITTLNISTIRLENHFFYIDFQLNFANSKGMNCTDTHNICSDPIGQNKAQGSNRAA